MFVLYNTKKKQFACLGYIYTDVGASEDSCVASLSYSQTDCVYMHKNKEELERILLDKQCSDSSYNDDYGFLGEQKGSALNPYIMIEPDDYKDTIIVEVLPTLPE